LLPILDDFSPARAETYLRNLASKAPVIRTSAKSGEGMDNWLNWLRELVTETRLAVQQNPDAHTHTHHHHNHDHGHGHSKDRNS